MMYSAVYDAVNSITPIGEPYRGRVPELPVACSLNRHECLSAAVNAAAASALIGAFPEQALFIASRLVSENLRIGLGPAADAGGLVGLLAAAQMDMAQLGDRSGDRTPYTLDGVPGSWRPTNGCTAAAAPNWGRVKPFAMTSTTQFRPPRPGGFTSYSALLASPLYARQLNEVKSLGGAVSGARTAEQTEIAFFWANDLAGSYHPPGQHLDHTRIISQQRGLTLRQNARLFGLVGLALGDAGVIAWGSKYLTPMDMWRPQTAIPLADVDGNPATTADPGWKPLLVDGTGKHVSPCFPSYVSGHATFAGAWSTIMRRFFGTDHIRFTATTDDQNAGRNVTRTFASLDQAALEDARSRIYLGVHFPYDADDGLAAGKALGDYIYATQLRRP